MFPLLSTCQQMPAESLEVLEMEVADTGKTFSFKIRGNYQWH